MPTPCAYNLTRQEIHYRHDAFTAGLKAAGYEVHRGAPPGRVNPGDALLIWNRYGGNHDIATRFEAQGGVVLVAENGFVGPGGVSPHSMDPRAWYALAKSRHNGGGTWAPGDGSRWAALGVELQPWRQTGSHILVAANRSFGTPGYAMDVDWPQRIVKALQARTKREVRLRAHPGNDARKAKPIAADLDNAWACVVWSSSAGCEALIRGVPVICCARAWICKDAAQENIERLEEIRMPDRLPVFERLAWAQWHIDEIAAGEPFRRLLSA